MLAAAGNPDRLWPHIKTHKTAELIRDLLARGVSHYKCATVAEAELLAVEGAAQVLIAYPLVGPNVNRFAALAEKYPATFFSCLIESRGALDALVDAFADRTIEAGVFVDLDMGMGRTGIPPGDEALELCRAAAQSPGLKFMGLHAYDGHNRQSDREERKKACAGCIETVRELRATLDEGGIAVEHAIFGGTPTFTCYAEWDEAELSPGTAFLYDWGYQKAYPDLPFEPAACVLGRVISSRPGDGFTLDVGSKAIATDPAGPRGTVLGRPGAEPQGQSEEHWVFADRSTLEQGQTVLVVPTHICPTVNLHEYGYVIDSEGNTEGTWKIVARSRKLSI